MQEFVECLFYWSRHQKQLFGVRKIINSFIVTVIFKLYFVILIFCL